VRANVASTAGNSELGNCQDYFNLGMTLKSDDCFVFVLDSGDCIGIDVGLASNTERTITNMSRYVYKEQHRNSFTSWYNLPHTCKLQHIIKLDTLNQVIIRDE